MMLKHLTTLGLNSGCWKFVGSFVTKNRSCSWKNNSRNLSDYSSSTTLSIGLLWVLSFQSSCPALWECALGLYFASSRFLEFVEQAKWLSLVSDATNSRLVLKVTDVSQQCTYTMYALTLCQLFVSLFYSHTAPKMLLVVHLLEMPLVRSNFWCFCIHHWCEIGTGWMHVEKHV